MNRFQCFNNSRHCGNTIIRLLRQELLKQVCERQRDVPAELVQVGNRLFPMSKQLLDPGAAFIRTSPCQQKE